jgi:hypothetical protein
MYCLYRRRLAKGHAGVLFAEHIHAKGVELYRAVCDRDLEGILCKHAQAPFVATPATWLKVLNPNYSQKRGRREMFEKFHERQERRDKVFPSAEAPG